MKRGWMLGLIMGIIVATAVIAIPAFAAGSSGQGNTDGAAMTDIPQPVMANWAGYGSGNANGTTNMHMYQSSLAQLAQALNLTTDQLVAQLESGKPLSQIASEQGVSEEVLVEIMVAPCRDHLQGQVSYGYMAQEQANAYLEQARTYALTLMSQNLSGLTGNGMYPLMGMYDHCYDMMSGWQNWQDGWNGMMGNGWQGCMGRFSGRVADNDSGDTVLPQQNISGTVRGWSNIMRGGGRMGCW